MREMRWPGGRVPLSEPPCGFKGEKCVSKYNIVMLIHIKGTRKIPTAIVSGVFALALIAYMCGPLLKVCDFVRCCGKKLIVCSRGRH